MIFAEWRAIFEAAESHFGASQLAIFPGSYVIRSKAKPSRAIVFVHGFNGCPTKTWESYHDLLANDPRFRDANLYYYSYDSLHTGLDLAVQELSAFLTHIHASGDFEELICVGHSLGGLMLRLAIVRAWKAKERWVDNVRMLLVAPAQCGARISQLILSSVGAGLQGIILFAPRYRWVILDDLERTSPQIVGLRTLLESLPPPIDSQLIPIALVVPPSDRVVHQELLPGDPKFSKVNSTNHGSISKCNGPTDSRYLALTSFL